MKKYVYTNEPISEVIWYGAECYCGHESRRECEIMAQAGYAVKCFKKCRRVCIEVTNA